MKLTHKLCGAALLTVIGVGLALPSVAKADGGDAKVSSSTGKIKFKQDGTGTDIPTPPETDGPEITQPPVNPDNGPLKVITIAPLDFGTNEVTTPTANGWEYYASTFKTTEKDNADNTIEMPNFVTFKDERADDLPNKYKLTAKATTFKNTAGKELKAATLTYDNIRLTTTGDAGQINPTAAAKTQVLATDGTTPTEFVNQDADDKGFGRFDLVFGKMADGNADKSVKLSIPAANNKLSTASEYTSTITWTIADAR
ncbi:hypothetical protein BCR24_13155 [Enterococcus ureilyticus]|uniref:WxL domain-containing protein n=1 Tax=Enterococcus ureilyticus TaxID=1131292 RepID=A0A1E5HDT3_9ENTE|nr:WxL domain-containing protein [Enterococcus ureilyticus]MBM7689833.1 hypothetical protein [Enterococcus ureilyticus]MBO0447717.1 WxL domain-containing protein [Enterococcus ureilyticus]OEG23094.1 hypothetical protein BCR24_13155 [Enterococcus ureilyticus]